MDKDLSKILLPMIKKITPNLIAAQLVGVQPISFDTGEIFTEGYRWAPYRIVQFDSIEIPWKHKIIANDEVYTWLEETFINGIDFTRKEATVLITEEVLVMLKLKWS